MKLACDMSEPVERLRKLGYSDRAILVVFEKVWPRSNSLETGAVMTPPLIRSNPSNLRRIDDARVQLYTLDDFLGPQECERVIALVGHHLKPSKLSSYGSDDKSFRTSQTAELC